jgi:coenzyme F420-reducing hydrogenase delta subunit
LESIGVDPNRLRFSWISSAEANKFQAMAKDVVENVKACGPNTSFRKEELKLGLAEVA